MHPAPLLYHELASWWPVMSAPADYAEEAGIYRAALDRHAPEPIRTLLELGSGGGNNASHLKEHYQLTLVDLSPQMLEVSQRLNPECEHIQGDMRSVRLGRIFDAVMIHDAIAYMLTEEDLRAALATAFAHLRPGGPALFVPDHTRETWRGITHHGGHDLGDRSFRYVNWDLDPDPSDTEFLTCFAYLLREGDGPVRCLFDQHRVGLFPRATWLRLMEEVGFLPRPLPYPHSEFAPENPQELLLGIS